METIVQLILAIAALFAVGFVFKIVIQRRNETHNQKVSQTSKQKGNNNVSQNVNLYVGGNQNADININKTTESTSARDSAVQPQQPRKQLSKATVQILFIDDLKFDNISVLKKAGWQNTKSIKDVNSLDCPEILNADIIFVDNNDVGKNLFPKEQGLGVAHHIKETYPDKCVVLYSAQPQQLNEAMSKLNAVLDKSAEPYQYISIIEDYINECGR